jgi:glycosyltransferase involved in cell wall biosynthesis
MKKLLFILPDVGGGVRTYNTNLRKVLNDQEGVETKLVAYSYIESFSHKKEKGADDQVHMMFSKYSSVQSQYNYLQSEINQNDILICSDSFELGAIEGLGLANKVIFLLHGDLEHYNNTIDKYNHLIDLVLCVSNGLKEKYSAIFPALRFGIAHPFILNTLETTTEEVRHSAGPLHYVFIGRFEYLKGADLFIELVNKCEGTASWTVITTNSGNDPLLLKRLPEHVSLYKDISNGRVLEILNEMDVLIFPSRTEGFGLAVLEAMSKGVVPVVADIPIGIPDQVIHEYNGFIVNQDRWNDAGMVLQRLNDDRTLLLKMKLNAKRFVRERFNPQLIAMEFARQVEDVAISGNRHFRKPLYNFYERVIPETLYRVLKILYYRLFKKEMQG